MKDYARTQINVNNVTLIVHKFGNGKYTIFSKNLKGGSSPSALKEKGRARPYVGINTQSHIRVCCDPEPFLSVCHCPLSYRQYTVK